MRFCSSRSFRLRASSISRSSRRAPFSSCVSGRASASAVVRRFSFRSQAAAATAKPLRLCASRRGLAGQCAILLCGLRIAPAVIVGIAQTAQLGRRQAGLGAHRRQLGARSLRFRAQRVSQQQPLEYLLCLLRLPQRECHLPLRKLEAGAVRGCRSGRLSQHLLRARRHCPWPAARWPPVPAPGH